jgi:hypothetical protein
MPPKYIATRHVPGTRGWYWQRWENGHEVLCGPYFDMYDAIKGAWKDYNSKAQVSVSV